MAYQTPTIVATTRDRLGSRYSQRLRKAGRLPGVIYGHRKAPVAISVEAKEMLTHLQRGLHVVNVHVDGGATETCLVKDLQFGYLGDNVIHIDFARVDLDEEVHVNVAIRFVGTPAAATKPGVVLTHDMTQLEVICKVNAIPGEIRVDLSSLETTFTVGEINLPENVRAAARPDSVVAHISLVHEEVPTGEAAEVAPAAPAEPEVITAKKEEEAPPEE
jgi:large subunit ribosomal protein L25